MPYSQSSGKQVTENTKYSGFSLVELSIVLVILGLLTGGILAGQSLIRAAELRSVTTELRKYQTAMMTFRDKYFALPGDMNNAYAFWGASAGCTDVDSMVDNAGCNGDGNGIIESFAEGFRMWQHLALAGLIEGSYTGSAGGNDAVLGGNIPKAKIGNAGYQIWNEAYSANGWTGSSSSKTSYAMRFGLWQDTTPDRITLPAISCDEAWNLDKKLDDGKPSLGILSLHYILSSNCISATDMSTAEYIFTNNGAKALVDFQYLR